jgi:hypothetical protein
MSEPAARRYRATMFTRPIGPWRARRILAAQDAIDEGYGSREWQSGRFFLDEAVYIEDEPGDEPLPENLHHLARALTLHAKYGDAALAEAERRLGGRPEEVPQWRGVIDWMKIIRRQAQEHARAEGEDSA